MHVLRAHTHTHTHADVFKRLCVLTAALLKTAGRVSSGTGSACCNWMTSSLCCIKGLCSSDDQCVGYQHSHPHCGPTVLLDQLIAQTFFIVMTQLSVGDMNSLVIQVGLRILFEHMEGNNMKAEI